MGDDRRTEGGSCLQGAGAARDEKFERLFAALRTAQRALEDFAARGGGRGDPRVRQLLAAQLEEVLRRRYRALRKHLARCRSQVTVL